MLIATLQHAITYVMADGTVFERGVPRNVPPDVGQYLASITTVDRRGNIIAQFQVTEGGAVPEPAPEPAKVLAPVMRPVAPTGMIDLGGVGVRTE